MLGEVLKVGMVGLEGNCVGMSAKSASCNHFGGLVLRGVGGDPLLFVDAGVGMEVVAVIVVGATRTSVPLAAV